MLQEKLTPEAFSEIVAKILPGVSHLMPEVTLTLFACVIFLLDLVLNRKNSRGVLGAISLIGLAVALGFALDGLRESKDPFAGAVFSGMVTIDTFGSFFKVLFHKGFINFDDLLDDLRVGVFDGREVGFFAGLSLEDVDDLGGSARGQVDREARTAKRVADRLDDCLGVGLA